MDIVLDNRDNQAEEEEMILFFSIAGPEVRPIYRRSF